MPKKIVIVGFLACSLLCILAPFTQAMGSIRLEVNGQIVTDDLDYQLKNQNILIPLGSLTEALPLKIRWFESIQTLQLQFHGRIVKARLSDKRLQINDQLLRMPVAVQRKNGKFMVPLQILSQALGLRIEADQAARVVKIFEIDAEVQQISYVQDGSLQGVKVQTTSQVKPEINYLENPDRIILDLPAATLEREFKYLEAASELIKGIRIAQFDATTVRVVVDLTGKAHYKLAATSSGSGYNYLIKVSPVIKEIEYTAEGLKIAATGNLQATAPVHLTKPQRVMVDIKNAVLIEEAEWAVKEDQIKKIEVSQHQAEPIPIVRAVVETKRKMDFRAVNQCQKLLLRPVQAKFQGITYSSQQPREVKFNLTKRQKPRKVSLKKGNRLVFDFPNTANKFSPGKLSIKSELIEEIRVGQFDQNTTRAVIELTKLVPYQTDWEKGKFTVKLMNKLQQVRTRDKTTKMQVNLSLLGKGTYQVHKLYHPERLIIDLQETIVDKSAVELINKSQLVREVRVSQYRVKPNITRVVVDLKENFDFTVQSSKTAQQIVVKVNQRNLTGEVIVLDPGHGGIDPGAIGPTGLEEKKVVLAIAQKTKKLLEKAGAKVLMTRNKDKFVPLEKRVTRANELKVDLFVSIHANGYRTDEPDGTETFIKANSGQRSRLLGQFVQEELVENLGTHNRHVRTDGLYVLENCQVPAILTEVAFITNPRQEKLLAKEKFRFRAAVGLYEGISQYFKWLAEEES